MSRALAGLIAGTLICFQTTAWGQSTSLSDVLDGLFSINTSDQIENPELNYRLEIPEHYRSINASKLIPGADFAAVRDEPNAAFAVIVEKIPQNLGLTDYQQLAVASVKAYFESSEKNGALKEQSVNELNLLGAKATRWHFDIHVAGQPYHYVSTVFVHNGVGYQVLGWSRSESNVDMEAEATTFIDGFSFLDQDRVADVDDRRDVSGYLSLSYGYRMRARSDGWFQWMDVDDSVSGTDLAVLSNKGAGMVLLPMCWDEDRVPHDEAIKTVLIEEIGAEYDESFITSEKQVSKNGYPGFLIRGERSIDSDPFHYKVWITKVERCSLMLAVWVVDKPKLLDKLADPFWQGLAVFGGPGFQLGPQDESETAGNAMLVNRLGLHYHHARSYRKAFQYFEDAYGLVQKDTYFTNALQALNNLHSYDEAYAWGKPHFEKHTGNEAKTWHAWLLSQNERKEKAIQVYDSVFSSGFRSDGDFETYVELLAEAEDWKDFDRVYESYSSEPISPALQRTIATLLASRGEHERSLKILDSLEVPNRYDADLSFARIEVLKGLKRWDEVLVLSQELIDKGYDSAQSYYYKGDAQYNLGKYREAKQSMVAALEYAPRNANLKSYLRDISVVLGDGDNVSLLSKVQPVPLIKPFKDAFSNPVVAGEQEGYDSYYLTRVRGFSFTQGEPMTTTHYRQIKVLNKAGVERFGSLEMDFNPNYEKLYVNELSVLDETGEVVASGDPDSYYVVDKESALASFDQTAHFPVPNLRPGYTIRAVISIADRAGANEFPVERVYLSTDRPIGTAGVYVVGESIGEIDHNHSGGLSMQQSGDSVYWKKNDPVVYQWEPMLPDYEHILEWVQLGSVAETWGEVGKDYLDDINDKLDFERVANRARSLVKDETDTRRKIEILSAYVQREIHYKALEFGRRAIIPKTARETMRDRYGDCKDHATLLYALLQAIDIDASLALVNSTEAVNPGLPNLDQFNHMVVHVQLDDRELYIDTTDKDSNLTKIPPRGLGGTFALVLSEQPDLLQIPDYPVNSNLLQIERQVRVAEGAPVVVTEYATFSGYLASNLRGQFREIESAQLKERLQGWLADQYKDAELTDFFVDNVFDPSSDLTLELVYTMPGDLEDERGETPIFLEREFLEQQRFSDKKFPFERHYPFRLESETKILADGVIGFPEGTLKAEGDTKYANWLQALVVKRELKVKKEGTAVRFSYQADRGQYASDGYMDYEKFHRKLLKGIPIKYTLK